MSDTDNDAGLDQPAEQLDPAPEVIAQPVAVVEPPFNTDKLKAVLIALGAFTGDVEKYFDGAVALVKSAP